MDLRVQLMVSASDFPSVGSANVPAGPLPRSPVSRSRTNSPIRLLARTLSSDTVHVQLMVKLTSMTTTASPTFPRS